MHGWHTSAGNRRTAEPNRQPHRATSAHGADGAASSATILQRQAERDRRISASGVATMTAMGTSDKRYGTKSGSGSNEPKHDEKKESPERGWVSRQGGDQSRGEEDRQDRDRHVRDEEKPE
jgi:hypothetical protein